MSIQTASLTLIKEIVGGIEPNAQVSDDSFELSGGFTGSRVFYLYIQGPKNANQDSIQGHNILKLSEVRKYNGRNEMAGWLECKAHANKFMDEFSPEFHPRSSVFKDRWQYLLLTPANPEGIRKAETLVQVKDERLTEIVRRLSYRLFVGFDGDGKGLNPNPAAKSLRVTEALSRWLGDETGAYEQRIYRMQIQNDRLEKSSKTQTDQPVFANESLPRPELIFRQSDFLAKKFNPLTGMLHGDLHLGNILSIDAGQNLDSRQLNPDRFSLIDFEKAKEAPLFYDQAYLQISLLCALPESLADATLKALLSDKGIDRTNTEIGKAIRAIDAVVLELATSNDRLTPDLLPQWHLAKFAAAVNWATKRFSPEDRYKARRSYLVAALRLKECLEIFETPSFDDWPVPEPRPIYVEYEEDSLNLSGASKGAGVSGLLIVNTLLKIGPNAGFSWEGLNQQVGEQTFKKLREGLSLNEADLRKVKDLIEKTLLLDDPSRLLDFLAVDEKDFERRQELVGTVPGSPANAELRRLIKNKLLFDEGSWLQKVISDPQKNRVTVIETLREAANLQGTDRLSERTWNLRRAYYHAGIQLTADQMADAAVADFSHSKWQSSINSDPEPEKGGRNIPQLLAANRAIADLVRDGLYPPPESGQKQTGPRATVRIVEGGTGGGHTTYFLLKELGKKDCFIEYRGMELVPALAAGLDSMLKGNPDGDRSRKDSRAETIARLRERNRLNPLISAGGSEMVVTDRMEDAICDIWDQFSSSEPGKQNIDAFISSFAFHHVPNGDAIIRYIANDAQGYAETLDREPLDRDNGEFTRDRIAKALADGCRDLYHAATGSERNTSTSEGMEAYQRQRKAIINAQKEFPQVAVFLTLLEPAALTEPQMEDFCESIVRYHTYPAEALRCMLRNPQRDVLLTAQSLLRDGGLIVIADPDGTSNFNATRAFDDHELTIANFLSSSELKSMLEAIGFDGIRVFRLEDKERGCKVTEGTSEPSVAAGAVDLGYVVFARRDMRRERELADVKTRLHSVVDLNAASEANHTIQGYIASLGELLRQHRDPGSDKEPNVSDIIRYVFSPGDPRPFSGRIFRYHPSLRRLLHSLRWTDSLPGASVVATRRIHVFKPEKSHAPHNLFIVTDFPETPQEARNSEQRIFSHRDEADLFLEKMTIAPIKEPGNILDLCCGAGTLGIVCAARFANANVYCVDSQERSLNQVRINGFLNNVHKQLHVEKSKKDDPWSFTNARSEYRELFDLVLADPPFSLRPKFEDVSDRSDDGGPTGDEKTKLILGRAALFLSRGGQFFILAYALRHDTNWKPSYGEFSLNAHPRPGLEGEPFNEIVSGNVWRYRHDKVIHSSAKNNLRYLVIRLGDPTRPESMIYSSSKQQEERLATCINWLETLHNQHWHGLELMFGRFHKN